MKIQLTITKLTIYILKVVHITFTTLFPTTCRFTPTCSIYSHEAVNKYGVIHGGKLTATRLLHCHPFHRGGYDPVP